MPKNFSIILSCIDYRFWPEASLFFEKKFGDFDSIELAGASKNIASPTHPADKHTILENIKIAIDLHHANTLILTNHQDCGGYGGSKQFSSPEAELDFHKKELRKAKKIIKKLFPELKVETFFLSRETKEVIKQIR